MQDIVQRICKKYFPSVVDAVKFDIKDSSNIKLVPLKLFQCTFMTISFLDPVNNNNKKKVARPNV